MSAGLPTGPGVPAWTPPTGLHVHANGATAADEAAVFATTNADPYEAAIAGTIRSHSDKGAIGVFGAATANANASNEVTIGVLGATQMEGYSGMAWGVASSVRGNADYATAGNGMWGAEFDVVVLPPSSDGQNRYTGTPQNVRGANIVSGSYRMPQTGMEIMGYSPTPGTGEATLTSGVTLPQATIPVSFTDFYYPQGGYVIVGDGDTGQLVRYTGKSTVTGAGNLTGCTGGTGTRPTGTGVRFCFAPFYYGIVLGSWNGAPPVAETGVSILVENTNAAHALLETHIRRRANPIFQTLLNGALRWSAPDGSLGSFDVTLGRVGTGTLGFTGSQFVLNQGGGSQIAFNDGGATPIIYFGSGADTILKRIAADELTLATGDRLQIGEGTGTGSFIQMWEQTSDPAAPSGNGGRLFLRDNGAGKTQLAVRFATGAVQILSTEP